MASPLFGSDETRRISRKPDLGRMSGKLLKYHDLIIGVNDYKDEKTPDLKTAVKDAGAVETILKKRRGFREITVLNNRKATNSAIDRAFRVKISSLEDDKGSTME